MFDTDKQVDNRALTELMNRMPQNHSVGKNNTFINRLLDARFLVPAQTVPIQGMGERENTQVVSIIDNTVMFLPVFTDAGGGHYLMAFTDWDELRKWPGYRPNQQTIVSSYADFSEIVLKQPNAYPGFVINPFGHNLTISKTQITSIRSRIKRAYHAARAPKQDERILLGDPKIFPLEMAVELKTFLRSRKDVTSAYLMLMIRGAKQGYLIVLDSTGDYAELFKDMENFCERYTKTGVSVDFAPVPSILGQQAISGRSPFFVKWKK